MNKLDMQTAEKIIDFKGGQEELADLARIQLEGAVALHNMIADPELGLGYLADEVGMGKTYVALGVVALMRYFNPSLRVLYICPSRNVQDKWLRDYRSFIERNVRVSQNRIRTMDGEPAAPYVNCNSVRELIKSSSLGYYADFFIRKDSFSISMSDDDSKGKNYWWSKIDEIADLLPAHQAGEVRIKRDNLTKDDVKNRYAEALNYILPTFDLVVIDEAHNFKHPKASSDRNKVLSRVLGFDDEGVIPRVKSSLLLSATPYDRNIDQLRNQLTLVGKNLIPNELKSDQQDVIEALLKTFMVRRLNQIRIDQVPHTRNMYRVEHRSGPRAEIDLGSNEQKLVMALAQKKVGDLLARQSSSASFQTGMLASFESFAQSTRSEPVKFDGDESDKSDAQDRHVIDHIVDSYKESGLGTTLPHPKMDVVCDQLKKDAFENSRKQLVFVRRVMSVNELKNKLDDEYNKWLKSYIELSLSGNDRALGLMQRLFVVYRKASLTKNSDVSGGEYIAASGDADDKQPPKNDTFFAWFFRGALERSADEIVSAESTQSPDNIRKYLTAKNNKRSLLLEPNWACYLARQEGISLRDVIKLHGAEISGLAFKYQASKLQEDEQDRYRACQLAFIEWMINQSDKSFLQPLLEALKPSITKDNPEPFTGSQLASSLLQETFFSEIIRQGLEEELYPYQRAVYQALVVADGGSQSLNRLLDKLHVHTLLVSLCLRTGHGAVDLYLSFMRSSFSELSKESRESWMQDLVNTLAQQRYTPQFSTYYELHNIAQQLDLIVKTCIPEAYRTNKDSRRVYLSKQLNPISPVIGASGETSGNRSAQARKFRMPGYPLVLISTDVFQEGEDLHTFCDSVVHYGLSNSPVSIEQKTGRVDRVAAISHRNLTSPQRKANRGNDMIQVSFPHVKQSIELLQVRQVCNDINEFLLSLHKVSAHKVSAGDKMHVNDAICDKSAVPKQIMDFLETPYPAVVDNQRVDSQLKFVLEQACHSSAVHQHAMGLVQEYGQENDKAKLQIVLRSARISGETILSAKSGGQEIDINGWTMEQLHKEMHDRSISTFHRTCALLTAKGKYKIYDDVEILIGDEAVTKPEDIRDFFDRFSTVYDPKLLPAKSNTVTSIFNQVVSAGTIRLSEACEGYRCEAIENSGAYGFLITFQKGSAAERQHRVYLYESGQHCVFISKAVDRKDIENIDELKRVEKIIDYTWARNHHTDIVEFYLDLDGDIIGRAIQPINSLHRREFEYCVYALAAQADRLEYVFSKSDKY